MPKKRRAAVPRGPDPGADWLQDPGGVPGAAASDVPGAAASAARDTDPVADTITGPLPAVAEDAVVRRTADGWRVGTTTCPT